jgi:hypothetical protein
MLTTILMFVLLFACVAMLYTDGLWSNTIRLVNVIMAALLAMNFFEPMAGWLENQQPSYTYMWDFISFWALFIVFSLIFRMLTDSVSKVKVKFLKIADQIGSGLLALWIGWIMVEITLMSLNMAPLGRNCLMESFSTKTEERMVIGFAPDRQWLAFTQKMSQGAYAYSDNEKTMFDPNGEFLPKYATRRAMLESNVQKTGALKADTVPGM